MYFVFYVIRCGLWSVAGDVDVVFVCIYAYAYRP